MENRVAGWKLEQRYISERQVRASDYLAPYWGAFFSVNRELERGRCSLSGGKEVVTIIMSLRDEVRSFIENERHDEARKIAERMIKVGKMSLEEIALYIPSLSFDELKEIEDKVL